MALLSEGALLRGFARLAPCDGARRVVDAHHLATVRGANGRERHLEQSPAVLEVGRDRRIVANGFDEGPQRAE
jgi:hypothetical protein